MSVSKLTGLFDADLLQRAQARWKVACVLFAFGLNDPLGRLAFAALRELGYVPQPLRRLAMVEGSPVVACAAPATHVLNVFFS